MFVPQALVDLVARLAVGLDHRSVGEDEGRAADGVVTVLGHAAAHAGGVVRDDAADHGRVDRRGVGPDPPAERRQGAIENAADHARLRPDRGARLFDPEAAPVEGEVDEDAAAHRLAGERCSGGAVGDGLSERPRDVEDLADVRSVARPNHDLGHDAVHRSVGGSGQPVDGPRQDPPRGKGALEALQEFGIWSSEARHVSRS